MEWGVLAPQEYSTGTAAKAPGKICLHSGELYRALTRNQTSREDSALPLSYAEPSCPLSLGSDSRAQHGRSEDRVRTLDAEGSISWKL